MSSRISHEFRMTNGSPFRPFHDGSESFQPLSLPTASTPKVAEERDSATDVGDSLDVDVEALGSWVNSGTPRLTFIIA